jgi:hypothetical protein
MVVGIGGTGGHQMAKKTRKPRSLGELIANVYDDVSKRTGDVHLAARLTATEVTRWLIKAGRPDLALELADRRI